MPLLQDAVKMKHLLEAKVRRKYANPVERLATLLSVLWLKASWEQRTIEVAVGRVTLRAMADHIECDAPDIRPVHWTALDCDLAVTLHVGGYAAEAIEALTKWWEAES